MPHQLSSAPGRGTGPDGSPVFLVKAPGLFATWVYPVSLLLLWVVGQPLALPPDGVGTTYIGKTHQSGGFFRLKWYLLHLPEQ